MMQALGAVIEHLGDQPGARAADTALLNKLVDFLYDTENGHSTDWAIPKVSNAASAAIRPTSRDGGLLPPHR